MKKQFLNIITSPLFCFLFILIIIVLTINYFTITNQEITTVQSHNIEYCENIDDYDAKIEELNETLSELEKSGKKQDEIPIIRLKENIKIYEYLKTNNVNFEKVFDTGGGEANERFIYLSFTFYAYLALMLISACVYAYIIFTNDFDCSRYSVIYSNTRYKIIVKKIILFLIFQTSTFLFIYLFNYFISFTLVNNLDYYLVLNESEIKIINLNSYIFHFDFMYYFYVNLLISLIVISLSLLINKSIFTFIAVALITSVIIIISKFAEKALLYIGALCNLQSIPYYSSIFIRFFIIIPIIMLIFSTIYFEKKDLR